MRLRGTHRTRRSGNRLLADVPQYDARLYCDAQVPRPRSEERECIKIDKYYWMHPTTPELSQRFCGDKGNFIAERWSDCFYTRVAECPNFDDEGFHSSFVLWCECCPT